MFIHNHLFIKLIFYIDVFLNTQVPDEILINRCIGRRLDPVTRKIYHIKNFPPETEEIKARLVIRPDDTEEKVWFAYWHFYLFYSHCHSLLDDFISFWVWLSLMIVILFCLFNLIYYEVLCLAPKFSFLCVIFV